MVDTMQMFLGFFCFPVSVFYQSSIMLYFINNNALLQKIRVINDWFAIVFYFTMWFLLCFNLNVGFIANSFVLHPSKIAFTQ